jgi:hypothetical protein
MPFITSEARRMTDSIGPQVVGDRCFLYYRDMLRAWRASPRWTTAHDLYRDLVLPYGMDSDDKISWTPAIQQAWMDKRAAVELAWQVFFQLHVMPYELQKRTLNGEVDY